MSSQQHTNLLSFMLTTPPIRFIYKIQNKFFSLAIQSSMFNPSHTIFNSMTCFLNKAILDKLFEALSYSKSNVR